MIDHLNLKNFKCWKDTGPIRLAPLTVFFGANSSGKSSIGQFLMMLKQSVESSDRKAVFYTGNETSAVDLGNPSNLFFNQTPENHLIFSYDWTPDDELEMDDAIHRKHCAAHHIKYSGEVELLPNSRTMAASSIRYDLSTTDGETISFSLVKKPASGNTAKEYTLKANNYALTRKKGRVWPIKSPVRFYGFPDEAIAYYQNADFLQNVNLFHERLFSTLYYLGPLRNRAKRIYTWSGDTPGDVGTIGENAINAILAAIKGNRTINLKYKSRKLPLNVIIATMLQKMELIESIKIKQISKERQDYEVKVRTKGARNYVDIPDIGVGVSQVLPVITEMFFAPPRSTIIMEQPELHLHPSAQAHLADVMIDAIHARENGEDRNVQLLVESHSEYFLRRLQRRLAEEVLAEDELAAYFVSYCNGMATMEPLQIDCFGDIANWPKNFFGDMDGDIYSQTTAGIKKRMELQNGKEHN